MSQIKVKDLSFSYDTTYDPIFDHVSFVIDTDWKLGFVGRNGRGKTTFLNLLLGKYQYEGSIEGFGTFDYFPFSIEETKVPAYKVIKNHIAPFEKWEKEMQICMGRTDSQSIERYGTILDLYLQNDGYIIDELIEKEAGKLGIKAEVLQRPFFTLSSGEKTKLMLAALFLKKNNFLLIDEPTNHLDQKGREIVATYLMNQQKGYILVSHDRHFIDQSVDHILSINRSSIEVIQGNFTSWQYQKERRDQSELEENAKLKKDIHRLDQAAKRTTSWSDKIEGSKIGSHSGDRGFIGHKAAKMMQRAKNLENRQNTAILEKKELLKDVETNSELKLNTLAYHKSQMVNLTDLVIYYDNKSVNQPVNVTVSKGERICLTGSNGCGKSSIIKVLLGNPIVYKGNVNLGSGLVLSYISQETDHLCGTLTEYAIKEGLDVTLFMTVLRKLDFSRTQLEKNMVDFSGGQKKKVLLAKSMSKPAHVLVWDEPLNFIDVLSRIQIEELLLKVQPTMIFVEHDKTFQERIATRYVNIVKES